MKSRREERASSLSIPALVVATVMAVNATGCGSADSTPPVFAASNLPVSMTEFRIRLSDYTEYFVAVIDDASESVIDSSTDQQVRRYAMEFRLRAVNMFLNALNQPDPVVSLIDAWVLCVQLVDFLEPEAPGGQLFGEHQPIMIEAAQAALTQVEQVVAAVGQRPVPDAAGLVHNWAEENPLDSPMMVRGSSAVGLAEQLERRDNSALAALGRLQAGVDDMVEQFQRYISVMPRTVRWHSQLILHETLYDELALGDTMETLDILSEQMIGLRGVVGEMVGDLPNREELEAEWASTLIELEELIDAERARLLVEIDRQRGLIFDDVTLQREAIMADVESQIAMVDEQIQGRLDEVFDRIEALTDETLARSFGESERIINLVYRRVLTLLVVALLGGAGLMVLRRRLNHPTAT